MLYEYAVIPDVFDYQSIGANPKLEVIIVQLLRGLAGNGMLANLDKGGWRKYIDEQRLPQLPPALQGQVRECIEVLDKRNRLVRHSVAKGRRSPSTDIEWLELALASHQQVPFDGIVIGTACAVADSEKLTDCTAIGDVLDSRQWMERRTSLSVQRTPGAFRLQLEPILRHARKVQLIDPNAAAGEERFWRILRICASLLDERQEVRQVTRIVELHTEDPVKHGYTSADAFLGAWEKEVQARHDAGSRVTFRVFLWSDVLKAEDLHDRFILTDQCGISVGYGLDTSPTSTGTTVWSLLDDETRVELARKFDPATDTFGFLGSREHPPA